MTAANRQPGELDRLRAAYLALARHLAEDHDDDRGGNASQLHARHHAYHGSEGALRPPHPLPPPKTEERP